MSGARIGEGSPFEFIMGFFGFPRRPTSKKLGQDGFCWGWGFQAQTLRNYFDTEKKKREKDIPSREGFTYENFTDLGPPPN